MSQENVEVARAAIEDFIAGKTEFDADGALTRMAVRSIGTRTSNLMSRRLSCPR